MQEGAASSMSPTTTIDEAVEEIFRACNSYERMDAVLDLLGDIDFSDWLAVLGQIWSSADNVGLYRDDLVEVLTDWMDNPHTVIPELMTPEEMAAFEALPDEVTIYRGCCVANNRSGLSWSLSREVASRFPFLTRYRASDPVLLTAKVPKSRIAAIKLERDEQEVIVVDLPAGAWTEEVLIEK
jgi:hypothetical protein